MADDYSSDSTRTGLLLAGGQATGTFETANDQDWFKVSLTAGKFYTFDLSGGTGFNSFYSSLTAYNAQGSYITSSSYSSSASTTLTFKASVTGDYYIAAGDFHYSNFTSTAYTIKANAGVSDDVGDTRDAATALALDKATRAAFQGNSDTDYFKMPVVAGKTYTITPNWTPDGGSSSYGSLRLEDGSGNYVSTYGTGNYSFTATSTGNYYVAASPSYSNASSSAYTLTFSAAQDDYAANQAGAGTLMPGNKITGSFEVAADKDWFSTYLAAGTTYWFTLGSASGSNAFYGNGAAKMLDADGNVLATSDAYTYVNSDTSLLLQYVPVKSGVHYIEVAGNGYNTGSYTLSAALGEADDAGDTIAAASALDIGTAHTGRLAIPTDRDVYKISVTAGATYLLELTSKDIVNGATPALSGTTAGGYYADGLATYSKPGTAGYMVYTPAASGDFYLTVSNNNQRGSAGYTVKASTPATDDYAASTATTGTLDVGGKTSGKIDYTGDVDWIKVTLQYGVKYAFQLHGAGSGEGTLVLDNSYGANLLLNNGQQYGGLSLNNQGDGIYTYTTTTGGDYYIAVRGYTNSYNNTGDGTGSYTLSATALSGDSSAPTVTSYTPSENAGLYDNIVVQFNESIMRGSYSSNITLRDSLGTAVESYYSNDSRISINGGTLTINPGVTLKPGTKYLLDIPAGSITDLAGNKYAGGALYGIGTVPTVTTGAAGNDYLIGLGNGLSLDGGAGVDTAIYASYRSYYQVVHTAASTTVLNSGNGAATGDTLTGIERLMFSDTNVALDTDGAGGQAYRLYQAAFNRTPDKAGVGYWIAQLDKGASLHDVAQSFIDSAEFTAQYGASSTNAAFVNSLYQNVLHRAGEQAGVDYWNGVLAKGASRADVLAAFSEGAENQAAVLKVIGNGFDYTPYG